VGAALRAVGRAGATFPDSRRLSLPHPPTRLQLHHSPPAQRRVARVIAIANQKGGVGKTTTAVNLAASLAVAERRTLLIDGDPQGNATSGVGVDRTSFERSAYDVLLGEADIAETRIRSVQFRHLDVLPATPDLAGAEVELVDAS
jgi:chromosome partitioning protein